MPYVVGVWIKKKNSVRECFVTRNFPSSNGPTVHCKHKFKVMSLHWLFTQNALHKNTCHRPNTLPTTLECLEQFWDTFGTRLVQTRDDLSPYALCQCTRVGTVHNIMPEILKNRNKCGLAPFQGGWGLPYRYIPSQKNAETYSPLHLRVNHRALWRGHVDGCMRVRDHTDFFSWTKMQSSRTLIVCITLHSIYNALCFIYKKNLHDHKHRHIDSEIKDHG